MQEKNGGKKNKKEKSYSVPQNDTKVHFLQKSVQFCNGKEA